MSPEFVLSGENGESSANFTAGVDVKQPSKHEDVFLKIFPTGLQIEEAHNSVLTLQSLYDEFIKTNDGKYFQLELSSDSFGEVYLKDILVDKVILTIRYPYSEIVIRE